jgi:hypothetical protein
MSPTKSAVHVPVTLQAGGWHSTLPQLSNSWQGYLTQPSYPQLDTPSARIPAIKALTARMQNLLDLAIAKLQAQQLQRQLQQLLWDHSALRDKPPDLPLEMILPMMPVLASLVSFFLPFFLTLLAASSLALTSGYAKVLTEYFGLANPTIGEPLP